MIVWLLTPEVEVICCYDQCLCLTVLYLEETVSKALSNPVGLTLLGAPDVQRSHWIGWTDKSFVALLSNCPTSSLFIFYLFFKSLLESSFLHEIFLVISAFSGLIVHTSHLIRNYMTFFIFLNSVVITLRALSMSGTIFCVCVAPTVPPARPFVE